MSYFPGETIGEGVNSEWELLHGVFQQPATDVLVEVLGSLKQRSEAEGKVAGFAKALWTGVREVLVVMMREDQRGHEMPQ